VIGLIQVGYNAGTSELGVLLLLLQWVRTVYDQECWLDVL